MRQLREIPEDGGRAVSLGGADPRGSLLFSVVVASFNYEGLVLETLASLMAQTFRDFEVVVVDDGSTDSSVANV